MGYEFHEREKDLEPQASGARLGGPPRKIAGIGVLDPPGPPKRPPGPLAALPTSFLMRFLAGMILAGLVLLLIFLMFSR